MKNKTVSICYSLRLDVMVGLMILGFSTVGYGQLWNPNVDDTTYQNPIIHADYSDPDVVRVGDDYYMVSSSFNCAPALPVLHSRDLVNWTIINHVMPEVPPVDHFEQPRHGDGVWAPSIRYHDGWYYVYYGDPDFGIFMSRTEDPYGEWTLPHLVREAKGWIDPCPFWDEDGQAYLVHAFAGSRAGIKSIVVLHRMSADGERLLDDGVLVFDGHDDHPTIEGTKMYKRNGHYYIFAPGGGVVQGWQTILRSKNIYGPYEDKIVLHQGDTEINGPHQGAWIDTPSGTDWFVHFQEKQPYGRIVHLQPAIWQDDWLVIGTDDDGDGTGEPVQQWTKPKISSADKWIVPQTSDEFDSIDLGLQWQWHGNPKAKWAYTTNMGYLRMNPVIMDPDQNLYSAPNLLLQKMPAEEFLATAKLTFHHHHDSEQIGLVVMGRDYAYIGLKQVDEQLMIQQVTAYDGQHGAQEKIEFSERINNNTVYLRAEILEGGKVQFAYSIDGVSFTSIGAPFQSKEGKWIGAKVGLFCRRDKHQNDGGYVDVDWFRIE